MMMRGKEKRRKIGKKFLSGLLALVMTIGNLPNGIPSAVQAAAPAQNLLARYELLEDVQDDSGNGNHGTSKGNITYGTGDDAGIILPGGSSTANYVEIPGDMFEGQEFLTISAWVKNNMDKGNYSALFFGTPAQSNNTPVNYWLFNPYSPESCFKSAFTDSDNTNYPWTTEAKLNETDTSTNQGVWAHYTTVITPTALIGYINGELIGSKTKSKTVTSFGTDLQAYIGRSNYVGDAAWAGSMQDLRIYSTSLNQSEIQSIMGEAPADNTRAVTLAKAADNLELSNLNGVTADLDLVDTAGYETIVTWSSSAPEIISAEGVVTPGAEKTEVTLTATITLAGLSATKTFTATVPPAGGDLFLHYDFSQAEGTTVPDISGNEHDGTIRGSGYSISGDEIMLPGGASNSDAAYIEIPAGTFDGQDVLTISLWLNYKNGAGNYAAMFIGNAANYWLLNPRNPDMKLKSVVTNSVNTGAPYSTEYGISPSNAANGISGPTVKREWAMYTTIIEPGSISVYHNNTYIGSVETDVEHTISDYGTDLLAYIGKSTYADIFYEGEVRDVRVYTHSLSEMEVAALYYSGLGDDALENAVQEDVDDLLVLNSYVMDNLTLPIKGANGSKISWSSDSAYISSKGNVILPSSEDGDQDVILTATITMAGVTVTKEFPLTVLADTEENWLTYYMQNLTIEPTRLTSDITLPETMEDGAISISWSSDSENVLTSDGQVTRPDYGSGDQVVTLTAQLTYQGVTKEKVFALTVAEEPYGRILTYVRNGNTDRTDALHIGFSEDKGESYQALYNNQPILYTATGSKMMGSPTCFRKADGTYGVIADDNHSSSYVFLYDSEDLITFTNPRYVSIDSEGRAVSNPECVYVEEKNAYAIRYEANDGKSYVVYTTGFAGFTEPMVTNYSKAVVNAVVPEEAIECGVFEATLEEYEAILKKYRRVVNTSISGYETVTVSTGTDKTQIEQPEQVTANYSDGSTKNFGVMWDEEDWAAVDTSIPGTYTVEGTIIQPVYEDILIEERADPYVVKGNDGYYYFTGSYPVEGYNDADGGYDRIVLRRSETISGFDNTNETEDEIVIWDEEKSSKAGDYIWAPEMHFIGDSWYILFTASVAKNNIWAIRPHMLKCINNDDPFNPDSWNTADESNLNVVVDKNGNVFSHFSLDMTYFESDGRHYVAWAEKPDVSEIWLAEINPDEPWKLISDILVVSVPDFAWEWSGGTIINEGPAVLKNNGKIHLCFSGAAVDYTYCVGMLTATEGDDLLDINSWTKYATPLLKSEDFENDEYDPQCGPGHNSFTIDENGNPVIVYHARPMECSNALDANGNFGTCAYVNSGDIGNALIDPCRHARAKSLNFAADGTPILNMTPSEELATTSVTWTIVVEGEVTPPEEDEHPAKYFYAEKDVELVLPAENASAVDSVTGDAVCTVNSEGNGITFTANSCGTVSFTYRKNDGSTQTYHVSVYEADNKAYVLDYGLPVDLNAAGEDAFGLYEIADGIYGMTGTYLPPKEDDHVAVLTGFRTSGTEDSYLSEIAADDAVLNWSGEKLVYTPTAFMEDADVYEYQVEVKPTVEDVITSAEDGVCVSADLTIVPASVVYYEEDFKAIAISGPYEREGERLNLMQSNAQNQIYGYDDAYAGTRIDDDLILHYDFAQLTTAENGTKVPDISGNGNDGVIRQNGAAVSGDILTLPGGLSNSDAAYVEMASGLTDHLEAMTVSLWLKNETDTSKDYMAIYIGSEEDGYPDNYWMLNPHNRGGLLLSAISVDGSWRTEKQVTTTPYDDGWALYTAVIENGKLTLYCNGVQVAQNTETGYTLSQLGSDLAAYIGTSPYRLKYGEGNADADAFYAGGIRDVRIYDTALDANRILNLYNETKLKDDETNAEADSSRFVSAGSCVRLDANSTAPGDYGMLTFTFTGTGFDLVGRTTTKTAGLWVNVKCISNSEVKDRNMILDTYYPNGAIYQLPLISAKGLAYEIYTVTLRTVRTDSREEENAINRSIYIDGIRIFNPAGVGTEDEVSEVSRYYLEKEYQADIAEIRNMLLGSVKFENLEEQLANGIEHEADENMILHYDFADIETAENGTKVPDSSGNGNDGTILQTGASVSGDILTLPGGDSGSGTAYVELPTGLTNEAEEMTISLWMNNKTNTSLDYIAMYIGSDDGGFPTYYWQLNPHNIGGMMLTGITTGGFSVEQKATAAPQDDDWELYTVVIEKGKLSLYCDGVLAAEKETGISLEDLGENLVGYIGTSPYRNKGGTNVGDAYFAGSIRDVRIYDTALNGEQIESLYEITKHVSTDSTVSLVRFDKDAGTTIYSGGDAQVENAETGNADVTASLEEILRFGPNNEVYLTNGNAIAFRAIPIGDGEKTLQVGLREVEDGSAATAVLKVLTEDKTSSGAYDPQTMTLTTHTEMYYEIDMDKCHTQEDGSKLVILASAGNGTISFTDLKVKGYAICSLNDASTSADVLTQTYDLVRNAYTEEAEDDPILLPYTDVTTADWFYDAVAYNYEKGLMTGMDETHFGPYGSLSRAQFATILYRMQPEHTVSDVQSTENQGMENSPKGSAKNPFKDVTEDTWYADAVLWAAENGIVTGYLNGNFGPADLITREQMAVMMYRYASYLDADMTAKGSCDSYKDAASVSDYAKEAMNWAVGNGITTGKNNGTLLDPLGYTARSEAAVMIQRFLNIK